MMIGDPAVFAIESEMSRAYERPGARGLGMYVIHLGGIAYGVRSPEATLLACSFDEVAQRLHSRGQHCAFFAADANAGALADALSWAIYGPESEGLSLLGVPVEVLREVIRSREIVWAPDGDQAFDDGSSVIHFDVGDLVRLIGFRREGYRHVPSTLTDVWLPADHFYDILQRWLTLFAAEWAAAPKVPED